MIVTFFLASLFAFGGSDYCASISQNPCALSLKWRENSALEPWILAAKSPETLNQTEKSTATDFLKNQIDKKSFSPTFLILIKDSPPETVAPCVANKFFSYTMERKVEAFSCTSDLQEKINQHFDNPSELTVADFAVMKAFVTVVRPYLSGEKERVLRSYLDEVKAELERILVKNRAPKRLIQLARSLIYTEDSCIRSRKRDKISFEAGKEIYVCQGFVWGETTILHNIWTLAHEASHAFDACDLSRSELLPFDRSTKQMEVMLKNHPLKHFYYEALQKIVDAKDLPKNINLCDHSNLHEAFADRMAAEIVGPILEKHFPTSASREEKAQLLYSMGTRICRIYNHPNIETIPAYQRHPMGNPRVSYFLSSPWPSQQLACESKERP